MTDLDGLPTEGFPTWLDPMLATLTDERFSDPDWIFERKLDGVRVLAYREAGDVRLVSRNGQDYTGTFPEIADAIAALDAPDLVVDGEVVAFSGSQTSFQRLQQRTGIENPKEARATGVAVKYYLFDVLHVDGRNPRDLPLRERKSLLRQVVDFDDPLRFAAHRNEDGETFYEQACRDGWEGLIAKQADAPYVHGRSKRWLKFPCTKQQELVIGGFTDPQGERVGFGALLVGYHEDDDLCFAGKVGTGYDRDLLEELGGRLRELERDTSPFADRTRTTKGVHWVEPELVGQVGFTEWTEDGRLRHPRFLGLRRDKDPADVVRERPQEV